MTTNNTLGSPYTNWLNLELQLGANADAQEWAPRFLRLLEEEDLVPVPSMAGAFEVVTSRKAMGSLESQSLERFLRASLNAFAKDFFNLPSDERHESWLLLSKHVAPFPPLKFRLKKLQLGLDIEDSDWKFPTEAAQTMANGIRELFVLPPHLQAIARRKFIEKHPANKDTQKTAKLIRSNREVAELEPELLNHYSKGGVSRKPTRLSSETESGQQFSFGTFFSWFIGIVVIIGAVSLGVLANTKPSAYKPPQPSRTVSEVDRSMKQVNEALKRLEELKQRSKNIPQSQTNPTIPTTPRFRSSSPIGSDRMEEAKKRHEEFRKRILSQPSNNSEKPN